MKAISIILSLAWIAGFFVFLSVFCAPIVFLFMESGSFSFWSLCVLVPVSFSLGFLLSLGFVFLIYRVVPEAADGRYKVFSDKDSIYWAIENALSNTCLNLFQGVLFMNEALRYLILKCLGADVRYSSMITTRTVLGSPRKLSIGERTLLGEFVHLAPTLQPSLGLLLVKRIVIGRDVLVGAYSTLTPGVCVGDHCKIQTDVFLSLNVKLGRGVFVGARTVVNENVVIEDSVRIGKDCTIGAGERILSGSIIPDGTIVGKASSSILRQKVQTKNFSIKKNFEKEGLSRT